MRWIFQWYRSEYADVQHRCRAITICDNAEVVQPSAASQPDPIDPAIENSRIQTPSFPVLIHVTAPRLNGGFVRHTEGAMNMTDTATATLTIELDLNAIGTDFDGETENDDPVGEEE